MTDPQRQLFPAQPELRPLTQRQLAIYEWICAQPNGVEPTELGQHLHAGKLKHPETDICVDCGRDGMRAIKEKAIRKRLVRRSDGIYEPRNHDDWTGRQAPAAARPASAQSDDLAGTTWEDAFGGQP